MSKRKEPVKVTHERSQSPTVGIKKTRLMQLGEFYGDVGLMNPRSIDPLVYMLAERGEGAFGPGVIDNCKNEIALTNSNYPKQKALCFLADQMVRKYLAQEFTRVGKKDAGSSLASMEPLSEKTYIDYFMLVSRVEREAFRTTLHPAMNGMARLIAGYQTEQAGQVCEAIVEFFHLTKNQRGFEVLLTDYCRLLKGKR